MAGCLEDQTAGMKGDGETLVFKEMWSVWQVCMFMDKKGRCFYGNLVCVSVCYCMPWSHWHMLYITFKRAWTHTQQGVLRRIKIIQVSFYFSNLAASPCCPPLLFIYIIFWIFLNWIWNADIIHLHTECIPPFLCHTEPRYIWFLLILLEMSLDLNETGHLLEMHTPVNMVPPFTVYFKANKMFSTISKIKNKSWFYFLITVSLKSLFKHHNCVKTITQYNNVVAIQLHWKIDLSPNPTVDRTNPQKGNRIRVVFC